MSYNLAYLRNRVLNDKLDDPTYDPGIVDRAINDTQRSIFNSFEMPFQEKVFNGTLPQNAVVLSFPADYQQLQSLVLLATDGTTLDLTKNFVDFRDFNARFPLPENRSAGRPSLWTSYGNKLYLSNPTDQDYILAMFYLKEPTKMELDENVPELPESFEEVIVLGAYYRILERNEDFDQAAYIKNGDYADELSTAAARYSKRQSGKTHQMGSPARVGLRRRGRA